MTLTATCSHDRTLPGALEPALAPQPPQVPPTAQREEPAVPAWLVNLAQAMRSLRREEDFGDEWALSATRAIEALAEAVENKP